MLEEDLFAYMTDSEEEEYDENHPEDEVIDNANDDHVEKDELQNNLTVEFHRDAVTALNLCPSQKARKLCLFNLDYKLLHSDHYDLGGTYNRQEPNMWFHCTTTVSPGGNYILNIFVCHRDKGSFKISICDIETLVGMKDLTAYTRYYLMPKKLISKTFRSTQFDKNYYIKSFCFTKEVVDKLHKTLIIPIKIELNPKYPVDEDLLRHIKFKHCKSGMFHRQENTDFVLESKKGNKYDVHKLLLATHSDVFKEIIKKSESNSAVVDMSDGEIKVLLEYLYSDSEKTALDENCFKLQNIAYRFKLKSIIPLKQSEIIQNLTVQNAIQALVYADLYDLEIIEKSVIQFIQRKPQVFETESWKKLNNVTLKKKLIKIFKELRLS